MCLFHIFCLLYYVYISNCWICLTAYLHYTFPIMTHPLLDGRSASFETAFYFLTSFSSQTDSRIEWTQCSLSLIRHLLFSTQFPALVSPRLVMVMIRGLCGTQTPQGAPTITGCPIQRAPRLEGMLQTHGAPYPRATLRLTRVQV